MPLIYKELNIQFKVVTQTLLAHHPSLIIYMAFITNIFFLLVCLFIVFFSPWPQNKLYYKEKTYLSCSMYTIFPGPRTVPSSWEELNIDQLNKEHFQINS